MCLVLGCSGSGKTLLLRRLQHLYGNSGNNPRITDLGNPPPTMPTVGTELISLNRGGRGEVTVREVGGSMAPIWHSYYSQCGGAIVFIIDAANRVQVSAAMMLLYEVLTSPALEKVTFCIFLNKSDVSGKMSTCEIVNLMRLEQVMAEMEKRVMLMEGSAGTGAGLTELYTWIMAHASKTNV